MIKSKTQEVFDPLIRDWRKILLTVLDRSSEKTYLGEMSGEANISELAD